MLPIVFSDVDNTLVPAMESLSEVNRTALLEYLEAEGKVVFVTGKAPVALFQLIQELGLEDSYHLGSNGAVLFNIKRNDFRILAKVGIHSKEVIHDIELLGVPSYIYYLDRVVTIKPPTNQSHIDHLVVLGDPHPEHANQIEYDQVIKLLYFVDQEDVELEKKIREVFKPYEGELQLIRTAPYLLEVHHRNQTKAVGLTAYAELHQCNLQECIAIGDSENDLTMLEVVGTPIIVQNASKLLKERNYRIVSSSAENGVAEVLNELKNLQD